MRIAGPASYIGDLIGESMRNPAMRKDFQALIQQRRSLCAEIVAQARKRGEVRKSVDPDLVLDLISGAIFYRKLFYDEPADAAYVEAHGRRGARRHPRRRLTRGVHTFSPGSLLACSIQDRSCFSSSSSSSWMSR